MLRNDPRQMPAKYPGECHTCRRPIKRGDTIIYFPIGKTVRCEPCGRADYTRFLEALADERACAW